MEKRYSAKSKRSIIARLTRWQRIFAKRQRISLPHVGVGILAGGMCLVYGFFLPDPLFEDPTSTILEARQGQLLGARIAADGQWRFPARDSVPENFVAAITTFEDKRFFYHLGVDPLAMLRAVYLNVREGEIVSGGSTLTMQVVRLARKGRPRTLWEKVIEMVWATRLEWGYSKQEILALYASHAPFGGNIVGLDAAAWKYFHRSPWELSQAEAALLAVLPNAPSLIHPGRNRDLLLQKRNNLLATMAERGIIDSLDLTLAQAEPLPDQPLPLPSLAPHLLEQIHQQHLSSGQAGSRHRSTLDAGVQQRANQVVRQHHLRLRQNGIFNAAALIIEVETGDVLAYVGNTPEEAAGEHGHAVDIVHAPRSSGSILKPFLYASMLKDGEILPGTLVADVPSSFQGYNPTNFSQTYAGVVPAQQALARSLNIPAVRMLSDHGVEKFQEVLKRCGMTTLHRSPGEYGLTLVLGGAEATLWDLGGMYASMARTLKTFSFYDGQYDPAGFRPLNVAAAHSGGRLDRDRFALLQPVAPLTAGAIWHTFEAMIAVSRPAADRFWEQFASSEKIAWKTGTSYGARDGWAIGCTPDHVIAVWVGNADGEGRPGLTGAASAAPLMFDLFQLVPAANHWFSPPYDEMSLEKVCKSTGYLLGPFCPESQEIWVPEAGTRTLRCPYHRRIHVDATGTYRVHANCATLDEIHPENWLVLPPVQAYYYKRRNPSYKELPPFRPGCSEGPADRETRAMELIYPKYAAQIYLPVDLSGQQEKVVFELAHRREQARVYWHLDHTFLGYTEGIHEWALQPNTGLHTLTWVDEQGEYLSLDFEILPGESQVSAQ